MTKIMSVEEIKNAVRNDAFKVQYMKRISMLKETHVIDENKSVKWNREEVARVNAEAIAKYAEYQKTVNAMESKMTEEIIKAYANEYGMSIKRVEKIYSHAYSEGHSGGMYEVFNELDTMMDLFEEVLRIAE